MGQKEKETPGPFEHFTQVFHGLYNQPNNRPRLKPIDILILADLASWSDVKRLNRSASRFKWNYEGFDTWAKRLGVSKGPLIKRFRRLAGLALIESIVIEHEGRRYHLKRVVREHLVRWLDHERNPNWTLNTYQLTKDGRLDLEAPKVKFTFDKSKASEDRLQLVVDWFFGLGELTSPDEVQRLVIQYPATVGPKMLKRCAEYCQLAAAEVVETHPMRIESKREAEQRKKLREMENDRRNRFKGVKARTLDTCVEAFMILGKQQRKWVNWEGRESERLVNRLSPENISYEAEVFFNHYEARDWQKNGGQHVDDIYQLADDWLKRRERKIVDKIKASCAEEKADQKRAAEAKQREAEAREAEARTEDVEYWDADEPAGQALQVRPAVQAEPMNATAEVVLPWQSEAFESVWGEWVEYNANELGRPLSPEREQLQLHKLQQDSHGDERSAIEAIVTAIANGYKGVFPTNKDKGRNVGRNLDW